MLRAVKAESSKAEQAARVRTRYASHRLACHAAPRHAAPRRAAPRRALPHASPRLATPAHTHAQEKLSQLGERVEHRLQGVEKMVDEHGGQIDGLTEKLSQLEKRFDNAATEQRARDEAEGREREVRVCSHV